MRNNVAKLQMEQAAWDLKKFLRYSVQVYGSADRQQIDSKFVAARFIPSNEISVQTLCLGISDSDKGRPEGLLDSFCACLENVGVDTEILVGVTTDGENIMLARTFLLHGACHRSDLALESVQGEVPELSIWMTNVLSFVPISRTSTRRRNLLHKENEEFLEFPKHFKCDLPSTH